MENYSQYRFEDFYIKHGWEGGITLNQVEALYIHALRRKQEDYRFQAALHGAKFDDDQQQTSKKEPKQSLPIFRDPEEYEHMSKEEKDKITQNMKQQHKAWAGKMLKGKKNG